MEVNIIIVFRRKIYSVYRNETLQKQHSQKAERNTFGSSELSKWCSFVGQFTRNIEHNIILSLFFFPALLPPEL